MAAPRLARLFLSQQQSLLPKTVAARMLSTEVSGGSDAPLGDAVAKQPAKGNQGNKHKRQAKPKTEASPIENSASVEQPVSGDATPSSVSEPAQPKVKAADFSLKDGERLGFFTQKPAKHELTAAQKEEIAKQDEWTNALKTKTAKIFAESELIEVGPYDSQRYAPVYADPLAEIKRHTDFSDILSTFKGTSAQQYYLELVTIALGKNSTYTVDEKRGVVENSIQYMKRLQTEPRPSQEFLIGFPTPSEKELIKPPVQKGKK